MTRRLPFLQQLLSSSVRYVYYLALLSFFSSFSTPDSFAVQLFWSVTTPTPARILTADVTDPTTQTVIIHEDDFFPGTLGDPFFALDVGRNMSGQEELYFGGSLPNSIQKRLYRADLNGSSFNAISSLDRLRSLGIGREVEVDSRNSHYYWYTNSDLKRTSFSGVESEIFRFSPTMIYAGFDVDFSNSMIFAGANTNSVETGIYFASLSEFDNPSPSLQLLVTVDDILGFPTALDVSWLQVDELSERIFFTTSAPEGQALFSVNIDGTNGQLVGAVPDLKRFRLSPSENLIYYRSSSPAISAIDYNGNLTSFQLVAQGGIESWDISEGEAQTPTTYQWANTVGGTWDGNNWDVPGFPDGNTISAVLGSALSTPGSVVTDSDRTLKSLTFDSLQSYNVAGLGTLVMEADTGNTSIDVLQGTHQFQAVVAIASANPSSTLDVDVVEGATLSFNNELVLNGNSLIKTGLGTLEINNQIAAGSGTVIVAEGLLRGSGTVGGNLVANGGDVSPGTSAGTLSVLGDYLQDASSFLLIELGGTQIGELDLLDIAGTATLAGNLAVSLAPGFVPQLNDSFEILSADGGLTGAMAVSLPLFSPELSWMVDYGPNSVVLLVVGNLPGDYNNNGIVDAADYSIWRDNLGSMATLPNDPLGGTIGQPHYDQWKSNFGMTAGSGSGATGSASALASVPEPSTLLLVIAAAAFLLTRRGKNQKR